MNIGEKVDAYIKLRDHKKKAEAEFKKSMERTNEALEKLESEMLEELNSSGVESVKGQVGTVYKLTRTTATVKDRDEFLGFVLSNDDFLYAMDVRANKKIVRELIESGVEVPGVEVTSVVTVGVRRAAPKKS